MLTETEASLLLRLAEHPDKGLPLRELPREFLDADLLTVLDADGLIEFGGRRIEAYMRDSRQYAVEYVSVTGPDRKPMAQFIEDVLSGRGENKNIHVRLTSKGRIQGCRLRRAGAVDRIENTKVPTVPQDAFHEVRELASDKLSGGQRRLVELLLDRGRVPVADVALLANVKDTTRTKSHANEKLLGIGWEINQRNNEWYLRRVSPQAEARQK